MANLVEHMSKISFKDPYPLMKVVFELTKELFIYDFLSERRAAEIIKNSDLPSCGIDPSEYSENIGWIFEEYEPYEERFHAFEVKEGELGGFKLKFNKDLDKIDKWFDYLFG